MRCSWLAKVSRFPTCRNVAGLGSEIPRSSWKISSTRRHPNRPIVVVWYKNKTFLFQLRKFPIYSIILQLVKYCGCGLFHFSLHLITKCRRKKSSFGRKTAKIIQGWDSLATCSLQHTLLIKDLVISDLRLLDERTQLSSVGKERRRSKVKVSKVSEWAIFKINLNSSDTI